MAFAYALRTAEAAAEKENLTQFEADTLKNALQSAYYYASTEYVGQFVLSEEGEIWASNNVTNAAYKQTVSVAINHSGIITDILYELPETPTYGTSGNSGFTTQTYYDAWLNYYVDVFNDLIGKTAAEVSTYQKGTERNGGVHYIGQNPVIVSGATQTGRNFVSSVVAACNAFVDNAGNAIMSEKANLTLLIAMIEASQSENVKASVSVAKALTGAKAAVDSSAGMAAAKTALKDSHATAAGGFSDPAKFAVVEATGDTWAASRVIADDYKITLKVVFDKTNNTIADILYIPLGAHVTGDSYFTRWTTADNANRPGTYIETAAILLGKTATEVAAYTKPSGNASGGALGNGLVIVSGATETGRNLISSVAKACNVYLSPAFAGRSASIQTRNHVLIGLIAGLLALTALTVIYTVYYRKKAKA